MARRKPKKTVNMAFKTTDDNLSFVIGKSEVLQVTPSEYLHRLVTQDRINSERELMLMAKAHGLQINKVNKVN
jgi:hypothetical protein